MKENELRVIVLKKFYENRLNGYYEPTVEELKIDISQEHIFNICEQLKQKKLIEWKALCHYMGQVAVGQGKITAFGIDVIEGTQTSPYINMTSISISDSTNVIVGDNNNLNVDQSVRELINFIEKSEATPQNKEEVKGILRKLLENPIFTGVSANIISLLISKVAG